MKLKKFEFIDFESKNVLTQKTWLVILMGFFVFCFYNIIISFIAVILIILKSDGSAINTTELMEQEWLLVLSLFMTIIGIIFTLVYVKFLERRPFKSMGFVKKGFIKQYFSGFFIGILMITVPVVILGQFNGNIVFNEDINYKILTVYLFGFLVQGASEEIMVRGYLLTSLAKTTKTFWAILISSIGFAVLHLLNPGLTILALSNLTLFGIFAALLFLRTKNIWAICGLHSSWNFFQGNVFGIEVSGQSLTTGMFSVTSSAPDFLTGGSFGLEGGLIVTIMLIVSSVIVLFAGENRLIVNGETAKATLTAE